MTQLYGRVVELAVGPQGETGRAWRDLKISFSIKKDPSKKPNKSKIQIYNLNETSRSYVEQNGMTLVLKAGYTENPPIIFVGDIANVTHERDSRDIVTTFEAGDGERAYQLGYVSQSFEKDTDVLSVFRVCAKQLGCAIGHIAEIPIIKYTAGYMAFGMVRDVLDEICETANASWSIQDNQLEVVRRDSGTNDAALLLSARTGLIGSPEKLKGKGNKARRNNGIKAECLLNGWLKPKRWVQIESHNFNGFYLLKNVEHSGSNRGDTFKTRFEATNAEATKRGGQTKKTQKENTEVVEGDTENASWLQDWQTDIEGRRSELEDEAQTG